MSATRFETGIDRFSELLLAFCYRIPNNAAVNTWPPSHEGAPHAPIRRSEPSLSINSYVCRDLDTD
jgi:hypothetical protein